MRRRTIKRIFPLFLLPIAIHQPNAWSADLQTAGCSLKTLAGSYSWDEETRTDYSEVGYSQFGAGWVFAASVGREINDGKGHITSGQMTINNTYNGIQRFTYTGVVTVEPSCVGTYNITLSNGESGGGGTIYIDPISQNFTLLDEHNIGVAKFVKDGFGTNHQLLLQQKRLQDKIKP